MKRLSYDNSPPLLSAVVVAAKLAAIPLVLFLLFFSWHLYDLSAGGGDDRTGQFAARFFLGIPLLMALAAVLISAGIYVRLRRGSVLDSSSSEILLWEGGVIVPFKVSSLRFSEVKKLLYHPSAYVAAFEVQLGFSVTAVLPGGGTVTVVRHRDGQTALRRGREISGLLGVELEEKAPEAPAPDGESLKAIDLARKLVERRKGDEISLE